jgi:hypothetical protein
MPTATLPSFFTNKRKRKTTMQKYVLLTSIMLLSSLSYAWGADTPPAGTGSGVTKTDTLDSNVRVNVINGVIERLNNTRSIRLGFSWNFLPVDKEKQSIWNANKSSVTIVFSNDDLTSGDLASKILPKTVTPSQLTMGAIGGPNFNVQTWHSNFITFWNAKSGKDLQDVGITPPEYLAMRRDHQMLYALLSSGGAKLSVKTDDDNFTPKADPGNKVRWEIRQYPFCEDQAKQIYTYRYGISANFGTYRISSPIDNASKVKIIAQADWQAPESENDVLFRLGRVTTGTEFDSIRIDVPFAQKEKLKAIEASGGPSHLESYLSLFGNISGANLLAKSLLGDGKDTSLVAGGVVTKEKSTRLIGFNREIGNSDAATRFGFLFGIDPNKSDRLFLGSSLRTSNLVFGLGFLTTQEDRAQRTPKGTGTFIHGEGAFLLSFDLSRALGQKQSVTTLNADYTSAGGGNDVSSDAIVGEVGGLLFTFAQPIPTEFTEGKKILTLKLLQDNKIAGQYALFLQPNELRYIPVGEYKWDVPEGFELKQGGQTLNGKSVSITNEWLDFGDANNPLTLIKKP